MSMLFLPCQDCGAYVGRTSANRTNVRCGPCTQRILIAHTSAPTHEARVSAHIRRMDLIRELCEDREIPLGKAPSELVDDVLDRL